MIEEKKAIGLLTLDYPLAQGRTINRWLVSGIREEPVHFEPVTLHGDINLWLKKGFSVYDNPCRTAFVKERQKKEIQPADVLEDFPGGKASWMG